MTTPAPPPAASASRGQAATPPQQAPSGGGNFLTQRSMMNVPNWIWILVIAGGGLAVILFMRARNAQNAASTQAAQNAADNVTSSQQAATTDQGPCYDASGNQVPCTQADYASQIAALQAEIDNMQGAPSVPLGTSTTTTSPPATTGTTGTAATPTTASATSAPYVVQPAAQVQGAAPAAATPVRVSTGMPTTSTTQGA